MATAMTAAEAVGGSSAAGGDGGVSKEEKAAKVMASPEVVHSSYVPAQLHRQLEFIDFNSDGHLVLGCSDLTGRNWSGSLWYFRDPSEPPNVEKALTGVETDQGIVDGRFVSKNRLIVALDNGCVEQISLTFSDEPLPVAHVAGQAPAAGDPSAAAPAAAANPASFFYLERQHSVQEHDDIISGMDVTADGKTLVTASYDKCVVSLDLETLRLESRFNEAHPDLISDLAANKVAAHTVATAAQDGTVRSWDLRSNTQQTCIYNDTSDWPTCVEWIPNTEHHLLVGSQTGRVCLFDVRRCEQPLASLESGDGGLAGQVHAFKFSTKRPDLFSVCGDDVQIKVFQVSDAFDALTHKYSDDRHNDFVRGMAWSSKDDDTLLTCGWDHKVLAHHVV